jgi:membrane-associated protease RseP (regulator of RpoE activity)
MKPIFLSILLASVSTVLISPAFAIEAPEDNAPPPQALDKQGKALPEIKLPTAPKPTASAPVSFLGIVSGQLPEILVDHLNLKPGEGVVVRSVVPDGPAAKSGIAVNDVITRVADQPVRCPRELSERIAAHQPGESLALEVVHKGKPTPVSVTLGSRAAETTLADPQSLDPLRLDGVPQELADRIRGALEGNIGGLSLPFVNEDAPLASRIQGAMGELKKRMQGAIGNGIFSPDAARSGKLQIQGDATVKIRDSQGSVEAHSIDGSQKVTLRDTQDKVIWSGPWNTEQDKAMAPADVRKRLESFNLSSNGMGHGMSFRMNSLNHPGAPGQ